jgi:hypothetical protein
MIKQQLTPAQRRDIARRAAISIVRCVVRARGGYRDARTISRAVDRMVAAGAQRGDR